MFEAVRLRTLGLNKILTKFSGLFRMGEVILQKLEPGSPALVEMNDVAHGISCVVRAGD